MAIEILGYPLNSTKYTAEDAQLYNAPRTSGIYSEDTHFIVTPVTGQAMTISVAPGIAWIKYSDYGGFVVASKESHALSLEPPIPNQTRVDRVVIRYDVSENNIALDIKTGAPDAPALQRDAEAWELGIADITVYPGTVTLTAANIADTRLDESLCGVMRDGVTRIPTQALFDEWRTWLNDAKTTLTSDVAANLFSKISELEIKVDDTLTGALETVWDTASNKRVKLRSVLDTVGISPHSMILPEGASLPSTSGQYSTTHHGVLYNDSLKRMYAIYLMPPSSGASDAVKLTAGYISTASPGQKEAVLLSDMGEVSKTYLNRMCGVCSPPCYSPGNNVVRIRTQHGSSGYTGDFTDRLLDTANGNVSPTFNMAYAAGVFATNDWWGYLHAQGSDRRLYYKRRENGGSWSNMAFGTMEGNTRIVGVLGNTVYFLITLSDSQTQLNRVIMSASPSATIGLQTFNLAEKGWPQDYYLNLNELFFDSQYIYLAVHAHKYGTPSRAGTCPTALRINMADGSSNWSSLPAPSEELPAQPYQFTGGGYLGTIGGYAYFARPDTTNNALIKMNKQTRAFSWSTLNNYVSFTPTVPYRAPREIVFNIKDYPSLIPFGDMLLDTGANEVHALAAHKAFVSGNYLNPMLQAYYGTVDGQYRSRWPIPVFLGTTFGSADILGGLVPMTTAYQGTTRQLIRASGGNLAYQAIKTHGGRASLL